MYLSLLDTLYRLVGRSCEEMFSGGMLYRLSLLTLLLSMSGTLRAELAAAENLAHQCSSAEEQEKVCVVYISQPGCPFCARMESEVLGPLQKVPWLMDSIDLVELGWEFERVVGFGDQRMTGAELMAILGVSGAPALLFLDGQGNALVDPILGYQSPDFFWFYLERAIELAQQKIKASRSDNLLKSD